MGGGLLNGCLIPPLSPVPTPEIVLFFWCTGARFQCACAYSVYSDLLKLADLPDYVFVCGLLETGSLSRSRIDYTLFVNGVSVYG